MKKIVFDLDGTLCEERPTFEKSLSKKKKDHVDIVNKCYDTGYFVMIYTARSWAEYQMTENWLKNNEVKYHLLICGKPLYDVWVDDRCINPENVSIELLKEKLHV